MFESLNCINVCYTDNQMNVEKPRMIGVVIVIIACDAFGNESEKAEDGGRS